MSSVVGWDIPCVTPFFLPVASAFSSHVEQNRFQVILGFVGMLPIDHVLIYLVCYHCRVASVSVHQLIGSFIVTASRTGCLNAYITMMTSSNGNIFRVTGHLCREFTGPGEFPTQRPVTRSFDVYFHLRPDKRLSKQSLGWWFETLSPPLLRHRNEEKR